MSKVIMVQGTMSNAGKSLIVAGLCRIFRQDGYRVCPFKSQNMALNSFVTKEGLEMGRAQVMQAEAAGIEPSVKMNPILLKPNSDTGSQIIVNGEVMGNMNAQDYYKNKSKFVPEMLKSYHELEKEYDIIVIEGAGSPAEINLYDNDIVNMGMAEFADCNVLLVGDIDRGGVFAQLYGTVELIPEKDRRRIKGLIINKFRGDINILKPGTDKIEELTGIPVVGVVPYIHVDIDDEDSLSERLKENDEVGLIDIVVIRLPRISNFTDFAVFEQMKNVSVRYIDHPDQMKNPDLIIIPGTKSTVLDVLWMRQNGLEVMIQKAASNGVAVFGICGGYQMLGDEIIDEDGVELKGGGRIRGLGLLPVSHIFKKEKHRTSVTGYFKNVSGIFEKLNMKEFTGYEIHHGSAEYIESGTAIAELSNGSKDGAQKGNVYGCYIHGVFDDKDISKTVIDALLEKKGLSEDSISVIGRKEYKEDQYNKLAENIRSSIDMDMIYNIMNM